jgi:AcrR family transcriptional regulator
MSEGVAGRRADAVENDAEILAAAGRLIRREGSVPSIRAVAAEAGVGSTTVYRRFANRDALQSRAAAALVCEQVAPVVERARAGDDPMRGLRELSDELMHASGGDLRTLVSLPDLVEEFFGRYRADIILLMEGAQQRGQLRPDIVSEDIEGVTTLMLAGLALPVHRSGAVARYVSLIFDGLGAVDAPPLRDR